VLGLAAGLTACGEPLGPITELPRELTVAERQLVQSDNRFAFKLFREINAQDTTGGNIFISPVSVAMALGMTYNGAFGETRAAMERTLELDGLSLADVNASYRSLIDLLQGLDPEVEFAVANSIWYRQGVAMLPAFLDATRTYFDARVDSVDFQDPATVERINNWVSEQTRGKITEIVKAPIPANVVAHLINAIYFKGDWTFQFEKARTASRPFTLADGSTTSVPMMSRATETPMRALFSGGLAVGDLAYGGGAYRMTIVLPADPDGADRLAEELTQEQWDAWMAGLDSAEVLVSLPRFTATYDLEMKDVLTALGMGIAFGGQADFSNMVQGGGIWIDKVVHKTFVDVNEEGTEAAAATDVVMAESAPPSIVVDRPFVFAIRERYSGTILFMGKIVNPTT
jgi:serpin B